MPGRVKDDESACCALIAAPRQNRRTGHADYDPAPLRRRTDRRVPLAPMSDEARVAVGRASPRVYDSLIAANAPAGIRVPGAGNSAGILGNQIVRSPKSLDVTLGGVVNSYGDSILSTGDAPTIVPKG
jgi:hypothetical protein